MWQPSALQPPCPSSRSKSQYAAVGSTPSAKCLRAIVTECTTLPRLQPSATKKPDIQTVKPSGRVCESAESRMHAGMHACVHAGLNVSELLRLPGDGNLSLRHKFAAVAAFTGIRSWNQSSSLPICCGNARNPRIFHFNMLRINCVCARVWMRASTRRRRHVHEDKKR